MGNDFTEFQSPGEQQAAQRLSMKSSQPPTEVPGYRIERLLGQGAFGQVWVGTNLNTGRQVAIKFYLHRAGVTWSLSREVKHLVTMSANRHIVQVLEVGWESDPPYYVMEYMENGSLEELLRREGSLRVSNAVSMITDIARGLNHSHGKGVLHCDLKPANILLDHELRPRLADFGQSRLSNESAPALGTLYYMAPEQADLTGAPDARWDVYGLGAILYCMLTGEPPYRSETQLKQIDSAGNLSERLDRYRQAIYTAPPLKGLQRLAGVDRSLVQILQRCLAREPERRFANVQQVLEALTDRQALRSRRPLQLLGIVGPLLLLGVMSIFAIRSIQVSENESLGRLQQRALESNRFAARFAARSIESELAEVFKLLEQEVNTKAFRNHFASALEVTAPDRERLMNSHSAAAVPREFRDAPKRKALDDYLDSVLQKWKNVSTNHLLSKLNSLFITDSVGTTFSVAFREATSEDQSPVGKNFAYRSYFNGGRDDSSEKLPASSFIPITTTHLSAAFKSTTTGTWKVAVSTPIRKQISDETVQRDGVVLGLFCLTIELSDISILDDKDGRNRTSDQIAVLVDGREGELKGTLLYHPLLEKLSPSAMGSAIARDGRYQIDAGTLARLQEGGIFDYADPVSATALGSEYAGPWIATVEKVPLPVNSGDGQTEKTRESSDLWMLVQEKASNVNDPVRQLGSRLAAEGALAGLMILAVICALWLVVWRVFQPVEKSIFAVLNADTAKPALGSTTETIEN
jgi:hypothetical protein